jgi:hypothetical protein
MQEVVKKLEVTKKIELTEKLELIIASCKEGQYGIWDASPEGFEAIADNVDRVAEILGIKLRPWREVTRKNLGENKG